MWGTVATEEETLIPASCSRQEGVPVTRILRDRRTVVIWPQNMVINVIMRQDHMVWRDGCSEVATSSRIKSDKVYCPFRGNVFKDNTQGRRAENQKTRK